MEKSSLFLVFNLMKMPFKRKVFLYTFKVFVCQVFFSEIWMNEFFVLWKQKGLVINL